MLNDKIVGSATSESFLYIVEPLVSEVHIDSVHNCDFIIKNKLLSHIYLPVVILFSWAIFNTNILTLADLGVYFTRLFPFFTESPEYVDPTDWIRHVKDVGAYMAVGVIFLTPWPRAVYERIKNIKPLAVAVMLALFWLSVYLIFCEGANPMVY